MENWNYLHSCWKFRIVREATLKLHCCGINVWVPISVGHCLAWWMVSLMRPHTGTWGAQSPAKMRASEAGQIPRVILGRHSENVSSESDSPGVCTFIARVLTIGFNFAFQKLFRFSFLTLGVSGVFWVFYYLWNTELSTSLSSVSSSDFGLSYIYVSTGKKRWYLTSNGFIGLA